MATVMVLLSFALVGFGIGLSWGHWRGEGDGEEAGRLRVAWCRPCWDYRHEECEGPGRCNCTLVNPARHLELIDRRGVSP